LKILFSIDTWGLVGGTERLAGVVVPGLLERGHELEVLCRDDQQPALGAEHAGLVVHQLEFLNETRFDAAQRARLAEVVRSAAPDVIFQQSNCSLASLEQLVDLAPLVRFVHDHPLFCPGLNKFHTDGSTCREPMGVECLTRYYAQGGCTCLNKTQYPPRSVARYTAPFRALFRKYREMGVNRRAARLLTNSDYMAGQLVQAGYGPELVERVWPFTLSGTPRQPRGPLDRATQRFLDADERPLVLTPARLTHPDKGVDYLLTAMGRVEAPFKLVVAGTGPAEPWLREKAAEDDLGPDRLHWAGWQDSGAMETLLERASVVVCPSVWDEPFGLVGLEAMAHAKPLVAFDVGGIPEWLEDGRNGYRVARGDTWAMAAAVDRLLGDREHASDLGRAGAELLAERFPREAHLEALARTLEAAAGVH
jgi:glycosyltransferase involved in cell wall biosynthesis